MSELVSDLPVEGVGSWLAVYEWLTFLSDWLYERVFGWLGD